MRRAYFPDDCDLEALCNGAGVDVDFDQDGLALIFSKIQETAFVVDPDLGLPSVRLSPHPSKNGCSTYFVFTDPTSGQKTHQTREHPNTRLCYDTYYEIARARALKEAELDDDPDADAQLRQRRIAKRNLIHQRALLEAELYYKETLGNPSVDDIEPADTGTSPFWRVAPVDIRRAARDVFEFDLDEEPKLAWVIRFYLATDLPPRWKRAENAPQVFLNDDETASDRPVSASVVTAENVDGNLSEDDEGEEECYVYTPKDSREQDLITSGHPGVMYFRGLLRSVREELDIMGEDDLNSDEDGDFGLASLTEDNEMDTSFSGAERRGILKFWHPASRSYYKYNFNNRRVVESGIKEPPPAVFISLPRKSSTAGSAADSSRAGVLLSDSSSIDIDDQLDEVSARRIALAADLEEVWETVETQVPRADLTAFASFVNVKLCGPQTEFLREIAVRLLSPLPEGWVRTVDPEGRVHYCSTIGKHEPDLWRESLQDQLPQWVRRAVGLGHHVKLHMYEFSALHPEAEDCRKVISNERAVRKAKAKKHRILQRQLLSEHAQVSRRQLLRGESNLRMPIEAQDPLATALEFYKSQIGDPLYPKGICVRSTSSTRSPQMLYDEARRMGVKADEYHLLWIPHMRLAIDLPPQWAEVPGNIQQGLESSSINQPEGSRGSVITQYTFAPSGYLTYEHPAEPYFRILLESARNDTPLSPLPLHIEYLEMIEHTGKTYFFNPRTMRKQYSRPAPQPQSPLRIKTPVLTRQQSSSCLSTSRMSTRDPSSPLIGLDSASYSPVSRNSPFLQLSNKSRSGGEPNTRKRSSEESITFVETKSTFSDVLARMLDENESHQSSSSSSLKRDLVPPRELLTSFISLDEVPENKNVSEGSVQNLVPNFGDEFQQQGSSMLLDTASMSEAEGSMLFLATSSMQTPVEDSTCQDFSAHDWLGGGSHHIDSQLGVGRGVVEGDDELHLEGSDDDGDEEVETLVITRSTLAKAKVSYFVQEWMDEDHQDSSFDMSSLWRTMPEPDQRHSTMRKTLLSPLREPPPPFQGHTVESQVNQWNEAGVTARKAPLRLSERHPFFYEEEDATQVAKLKKNIAPEQIVARPVDVALEKSDLAHFARVHTRRGEVDKLIAACAKRSEQYKRIKSKTFSTPNLNRGASSKMLAHSSSDPKTRDEDELIQTNSRKQSPLLPPLPRKDSP